MPLNPKNAIATIDAAISVTGKPLNDFGAGQLSILERTPAKSSIATRNPAPTPREETIASKKLVTLLSVRLLIVTPRTAQFVVMSGRYTPSDL